jgi:hypothetical protein
MAPEEPTATEGSRKSMNPSIARNGISGCLRGYAAWNSAVVTWAMIRVSLPTLAHLHSMANQLHVSLYVDRR